MYISSISMCLYYKCDSTHLQPAEVDNCTMLAIDYYDIRINSSECEILPRRIYDNTTFSFNCSTNHPSITFTVSVTIVNTEGQRSNSTFFMTTLGM